MDWKEIKNLLNLESHPEGGYYKETYRDDSTVILDNGDAKSAGTAICYMLTGNDKSHFHRVKSDEIWFFHQGEPLEIYIIDSEGELQVELLGNCLSEGERPQVRVKRNMWFAAKIKENKGFSLVSCTVSPGFEFKDFELAKKQDLLSQYPHLKNEIEILSI
jgi:predicted cupin superfamily sugar epimerase